MGKNWEKGQWVKINKTRKDIVVYKFRQLLKSDIAFILKQKFIELHSFRDIFAT